MPLHKTSTAHMNGIRVSTECTGTTSYGKLIPAAITLTSFLCSPNVPYHIYIYIFFFFPSTSFPILRAHTILTYDHTLLLLYFTPHALYKLHRSQYKNPSSAFIRCARIYFIVVFTCVSLTAWGMAWAWVCRVRGQLGRQWHGLEQTVCIPNNTCRRRWCTEACWKGTNENTGWHIVVEYDGYDGMHELKSEHLNLVAREIRFSVSHVHIRSLYVYIRVLCIHCQQNKWKYFRLTSQMTHRRRWLDMLLDVIMDLCACHAKYNAGVPFWIRSGYLKMLLCTLADEITSIFEWKYAQEVDILWICGNYFGCVKTCMHSYSS